MVGGDVRFKPYKKGGRGVRALGRLLKGAQPHGYLA